MRQWILAPLVCSLLSALSASAQTGKATVGAPTQASDASSYQIVATHDGAPMPSPTLSPPPLCSVQSSTMGVRQLVKSCVAVPAKEVRLHICYSSRCVDFCVPECHLLGCKAPKQPAADCACKGSLFAGLFQRLHGDDCATPNCSKVRTRKVQLKRVQLEECDTYKCEVTCEPKQLCRECPVRVPVQPFGPAAAPSMPVLPGQPAEPPVPQVVPRMPPAVRPNTAPSQPAPPGVQMIPIQTEPPTSLRPQ